MSKRLFPGGAYAFGIFSFENIWFSSPDQQAMWVKVKVEDVQDNRIRKTAYGMISPFQSLRRKSATGSTRMPSEFASRWQKQTP